MTDLPRVAILYGFSEGPWYGRQMRAVLKNHGFDTTKDVRTADIIIAHSAACYLIPTDTQAKLILHVGYTYWPGRSLLNSLNATLRHEYREQGFAKWLLRCIIHDLHMLNAAQTARMIPGWRNPLRALDKLAATRHVFVRNRHDSYCEPAALLQATNQTHTYLSMPGSHNHLWDNPETYVNLLQSVYE